MLNLWYPSFRSKYHPPQKPEICLTSVCFLSNYKPLFHFSGLIQIEIEDLHEDSLYPYLSFSESVIHRRYRTTSDLFWIWATPICCGKSRRQKEGNEIDILQYFSERLRSTMIDAIYNLYLEDSNIIYRHSIEKAEPVLALPFPLLF